MKWKLWLVGESIKLCNIISVFKIILILYINANKNVLLATDYDCLKMKLIYFNSEDLVKLRYKLRFLIKHNNIRKKKIL